MKTTTGTIWTGRILSGLVAAFLFVDSGMKLAKARVAVEGTIEVGYPESAVLPIGVILLICTLLYVIPKTSVLGAILLTGYLGGAVATHLRHGDPLFSHMLAPVYFGVMIWGGLYLREPKLHTLIPVRSNV